MKLISSHFFLLLPLIGSIVAVAGVPLPTTRTEVAGRNSGRSDRGDIASLDNDDQRSPDEEAYDNTDGTSMGYDRDLDIVSGGTSTDWTSESPTSNAVNIYRRNAAKLSKAGSVTGKVGKGIGIAATVVDAVPVVGDVVGTALQVVSTFLKLLSEVENAFGKAEHKSDQERSKFTQQIVAKTLKQHPGWNVVTTDDKHHEAYFEGTEHTDWSHDTASVKTALRKTYHYDVYAARTGIFILNGDGGFENWAYQGPQIKAVPKTDRLILSGTMPKNAGKPKSGKCSVHMYLYDKNAKENPSPHSTLVAIVKDASGMVVGFEGNGDLSKTVSVTGHLPMPLSFSDASKDTLTLTYGKDKFNTSTKSRCSEGKSKKGTRGMDCTFDCAFK